ncbi:MAG: hypothetical protein ACXVB2_24095, partial [Isosphaeraceae bacterium]
KSHERRIHGRRRAGVRIVVGGPTLVPALGAHAAHPEPLTMADLLPYRMAREPPSQTPALNADFRGGKSTDDGTVVGVSIQGK